MLGVVEHPDVQAVLGQVTGEKLQVMIDGELVHVFDWDREQAARSLVLAGLLLVLFALFAEAPFHAQTTAAPAQQDP